MLSTVAFCLLSALSTRSPASTSPAPRAPFGRYVEARTATVFAGACHYAGEATTDGREALLVWQFEGGCADGVDLAGVNVAIVIVGERNLAEARAASDAAPHSIAYVSARASEAQRDAVVTALRERLGSALGVFDDVRSVELSVALESDAYRVELAERFQLRGTTLADRACCKMPYQVWYRPFVALQQPIVGRNDVFRHDDRGLGRVWSRPGENASFTGRFDWSTPAPAAAAASR